MGFPTHEFRMFLAAFLKWAMDYPPKRAISGKLVFGKQRKME